MASFIEAVLKAKVAQICSHVGYNAITLDSANILVDIYRRTFIHLARHCKEAANNNRRVEPTLIDLVQAYDFVGISIPELREHIKNVKLPFEKEIIKDEIKSSNRIQRDLFVDDLLGAKKYVNSGEHDEDGENKITHSERSDEDDIPSVPLLKDVYQGIANQFPSPSTPTKADKLRIKREEKPAIPRLKITPLDPAVAEPPSFLPLLEGSKDDRSIPVTIKTLQPIPPLENKRGPKGKTKTKVVKTKVKNKTKLKSKIKTNLKTKVKGKKPRTKITTTLATAAASTSSTNDVPPIADLHLPSPSRSPPAPTPPPPKPPTPQLPSPKIPTPAPPEEPLIRTPTPSVQSTSVIKQSTKGKKKKKKSNSQFAIVTESVTTTAETEEPDWFCPACNGPDNGDLMLQCDGDGCELWFHLKCTGLKKVPEEEEKWYCNNCGIQKAKITSASKPSKGSKKRAKTSLETHTDIESKTPTPQPPTPIATKHHTPTPPPPPSVKHSPVAVIEQHSIDEPQPIRHSVICNASDDLCPECQLPDDGTLMIQCEDPACAKWFHGKCVNVLSAPGKNDSWFCKVCVDKQQSAFKRRRRVK